MPSRGHVEMIRIAIEIAMNVPVDVRQGRPAVKQVGQGTAPNVFTAKREVQEPIDRCVGNENCRFVKQRLQRLKVPIDLAF